MTESIAPVDIGTPRPAALHGLLAEFQDVGSLLAAAAKVRDAGYQEWDCHSPFPVHGLDRAMGLKRTKLPWLVFGCGLLGAAAGLLMQWWMNTYDYPFLISGKPYFSLPANIPVIFEVTVLFAALGAVFGMFAFNGLPRLWHPLFTRRAFLRVTTDRFFIVIEARDPQFEPARTRHFLESLHGARVETVEA